MSIRLVDHVIRNSKQEGTALLVLIVLADWANDGGYCFPSVASVARKARVSERRVQQIIQKLVEAGELEVQVGKGVFTKTGPTNRYILTTPERGQWDAEIEAEGVKPISPLEDDRGEAHFTPVEGEGVKPISPDPLEREPSEKIPAARSEKSSTAKPKRNLAYDAVAEAFPHLKLPALIQKHVFMLTGKDTGKKEEWNEFRLDPGLRPYEIHQFGQWMKERAEEMGITPPRQPDKIAMWAEEWREFVEEDLNQTALIKSQTVWVGDDGEDYTFDRETWLAYLREQQREAESEWEKARS